MQFLAGNYEATDVQRFGDRLPEVQRCTQCRQEIKLGPTGGRGEGEEKEEWNSEDGMTESIMSQEDDRAELEAIAKGLPSEARREGGGGPGSGSGI